MARTFHAPSSSIAPMGRPHRPHILIVDDEPQIVGVLKDLLEEEGYRVDCASDGHEAKRIIERQPPHLVISDLMMPRLSGQELVQWIRSAPLGPKPHIILMSAAREKGPSATIPFISKPFDIEDVLDMVNDVIRSGARAS